MPQLTIDQFIPLLGLHPVFDVRSPGEYQHAHIPGAYSLPLFTDEQRKVVGTAYKQQGRQPAIKEGLDYFGPRMRSMVEQVESILSIHNQSHPASNTVLVHCWRGGMRSAGVAWLLDLYGFRVFTLRGGYQAYRNWVLQQFQAPYKLSVVGGYTGSGKTGVLLQMKKDGIPVIDLEGIAAHKGSAFGALGQPPQPGQEMFENLLASELLKVAALCPPHESIWVEDESQRIGSVNLPPAFWARMQQAPLRFMEVPLEERLDNILRDYGIFGRDELINAAQRIQKRLGGLNTKNTIAFLSEGNYREAFRILLQYYDKYYGRSLAERTHTIWSYSPPVSPRTH
jgi:tRNA 2-selenouridine synthase